MIPYGRQQINQADIETVLAVLQSDFITQGPKTPAFEQAIADYCQVEYAIAVNSATSALHIACMALGVSQGDRVWTSPISFVASANCARYCGATIDFVDIDPATANISIEQLTLKLEQAKKNNTLPKVLIVVHMAGLSCDMAKIAKLAQQYHFSIIEDASHAIGAKYQHLPVGNCLYSDICVFSFHPVKIITTAEGGIATTNDSELAKKLQRYRSHGINRELSAKQLADEPWLYQQIDLGYNYRMTEMQAALGLSQLSRLEHFVQQRNQLAQQYKSALADLPIYWQNTDGDSLSSYHLFYICLTDEAKLSRKQCYKQLHQANIGVNVHYIPIHTQPYYQALGFKLGDFPQAEDYYNRCLSLPLYPDLAEKDFQHIINTLHKIL